MSESFFYWTESLNEFLVSNLNDFLVTNDILVQC